MAVLADAARKRGEFFTARPMRALKQRATPPHNAASASQMLRLSAPTMSTTAPARPSRPLLMVIGMHRSGTSATTGALACVGVRLGRNLYAGHADVNPKGYFEHGEIADTDDEALLAMGSAWDDILPREAGWAQAEALQPFARRLAFILASELRGPGLFAVKDPRVCRLLPWWQPIIEGVRAQPHYLLVLRAPREVGASLQKRDGFSAEKSQLLWLRHYLEAEAATRHARRAVIDFASFLADPVAELARVQDQLEVRFPRPPAEAAGDLSRFVSADLRHHAAAHAPSQEPGYAALANELHDVLRQASTPGGQLDEAQVDGIRQAVEARFAAMPALALEHIRQLAASRGRHELAVNRFMRSWSLWVGKPVRAVERLLGRAV
jgi:hypothetical protein